MWRRKRWAGYSAERSDWLVNLARKQMRDGGGSKGLKGLKGVKLM